MTDINEVRGKAVAWATNGGRSQKLDETFIASNKRYVETHRDYDWHALVLASDYAALQAEAEALRADAERYRWLRDWATGSLAVRRLDAMSPFGVQVTWMSGQQLDAAIDAAMAAEGLRHE